MKNLLWVIFIFTTISSRAQNAPTIGYFDPSNLPDGCQIVESSNPGYSAINTQGAKFMPKDTVVSLTDPSQDLRDPSVFVNVRVLSVPQDLSLTDLDQTTGVVKKAVPPSNVSVGMEVSIPANSLEAIQGIPLYITREGTAAYHIPELKNRAVRIARKGKLYLSQKCCATSKNTMTEVCQSTPIFELLEKDSGVDPLKTRTERYFTTDNCQELMNGLQPVSPSNLRNIIGLRDTLNAYSKAEIEKLQAVSWQNANKKRCIADTGPGTGNKCIPRSGNVSKKRCRQAVREILQELGYLPQDVKIEPDPGYAAANYSPWLSEQQGFEDITDKYKTSLNAPVGAVIVYEGGISGHIEIKVDKDTYCSDYCGPNPIDETAFGRERRKVKGIYLPKRKNS